MDPVIGKDHLRVLLSCDDRPESLDAASEVCENRGDFLEKRWKNFAQLKVGFAGGCFIVISLDKGKI